ncbi:MAG: YbhB/YbcL family Raf kinase inhibitor-like protein [Candidatus Limiplasma sp.]|nr:YbhB/YbcL family Raf kinase inhibitor-like protein [Candidatus Limiplasma sp.]
MPDLKMTSPAFAEGGWIPLENTARGADLSPELRITGIDERAVSLAITMDDASHPLFPNYNHWVIWNVPVQERVPAGIPAGALVSVLPGAMQGMAYGGNKYKGPKPPLKAIHSYVFTVYALDCIISLSASGRRKDLFQLMEGHILQKATLAGRFQSGQESGKKTSKQA